MKKILVVFGTRPEAIKLAILIKELKNNKNFNLRICVTAQHREMLDQVLEFFEITPDYDLDLMKKNQNLIGLSSSIMEGLQNVVHDFNPDYIVVHGDTTTAMISAIVGYYNKKTIIHVEAGLRTGQLYSPWPEEGNRKIIGAIANLHFSPTKDSQKNLVREGVNEKNIHMVGNTVVDALLYAVEKIDNDEKSYHEFKKLIGVIDGDKKIILVTGHRRENFGDGIKNICEAICELSKRNDVRIIYPVHLNPNIQDVVMEMLGKINNVVLIKPLAYLPFLRLMKNSYLILTDSGGVQEEAPTLGVPVLVMREQTERCEGVEAGCTKLVGIAAKDIINAVTELLDNPKEYSDMSKIKNPYGDGQSSKRIIEIIENYDN